MTHHSVCRKRSMAIAILPKVQVTGFSQTHIDLWPNEVGVGWLYCSNIVWEYIRKTSLHATHQGCSAMVVLVCWATVNWSLAWKSGIDAHKLISFFFLKEEGKKGRKNWLRQGMIHWTFTIIPTCTEKTHTMHCAVFFLSVDRCLFCESTPALPVPCTLLWLLLEGDGAQFLHEQCWLALIAFFFF